MHAAFGAGPLFQGRGQAGGGGCCTVVGRPCPLPPQMHHPNITQFLGACTKSKPYMLVSEYMVRPPPPPPPLPHTHRCQQGPSSCCPPPVW